ncbi:uncharacterized protein BCR38DRAFT_119580 [Pseudomassariella vexata]|uniref:Uncharacterized protein n=1 Tax=Pseudomassariella vexata TaxID=1141098 RepID=A0A1Y2DAE6_9PEZI|nr:uncharacterized protein BCR38DRAFT_119580 [Pseudomassariella vexata]ORY56076.1 hypothetical protein BCR38DRAFT_119580 [Pseudomassariella vexata]
MVTILHTSYFGKHLSSLFFLKKKNQAKDPPSLFRGALFGMSVLLWERSNDRMRDQNRDENDDGTRNVCGPMLWSSKLDHGSGRTRLVGNGADYLSSQSYGFVPEAFGHAAFHTSRRHRTSDGYHQHIVGRFFGFAELTENFPSRTGISFDARTGLVNRKEVGRDSWFMGGSLC